MRPLPLAGAVFPWIALTGAVTGHWVLAGIGAAVAVPGLWVAVRDRR